MKSISLHKSLSNQNIMLQYLIIFLFFVDVTNQPDKPFHARQKLPPSWVANLWVPITSAHVKTSVQSPRPNESVLYIELNGETVHTKWVRVLLVRIAGTDTTVIISQ